MSLRDRDIAKCKQNEIHYGFVLIYTRWAPNFPQNVRSSPFSGVNFDDHDLDHTTHIQKKIRLNEDAFLHWNKQKIGKIFYSHSLITTTFPMLIVY